MYTLSNFITSQSIAISDFGNYVFVVIAFFILFGMFLLKFKHKASVIIFFLTSTSVLYSFFLKALFRQPRPHNFNKELVYDFDVYGFPSTHVLFYTVFWGFLFYLTFKHKKDANIIYHILRLFAIYFIVMIGISRYHLGVHSIIDVVAGYIFGLFYLLLLYFIDLKVEKIFTKNQKKNN